MQVDRKLFAEKLKALKGGPQEQTKSIVAFGMKVLENVQQQMLPGLSFKDVGEISIPIPSEDLEKLKSVSQPVHNVKGLWEIDLQSDAIDKKNPHFAKYLSQTIPTVTNLALRHLKLSKQVHGLDIRPRKFMIMKPGTGTIAFLMNNTPEVFATMIVQLPFQGGHVGGLIKVTRENQLCSFENALDSSRLFYYTIAMSNASCHMAELSSGSRVMMTFDLICSNPSALFPSSSYYKDVCGILQQLTPQSHDRLLAIPIDEEEVSFSSLTPGTCHLLDLFNSVNFLQVRLALVCRYRMGKPNQRTGCPCCLKRKCPCEEVVMAEMSEEKIFTTKWLDPLDKEMHFDNLNINVKTELVGDGPIFFEKPNQEILHPGSSLLEQWSYRPMLVIWHKERSVQLDCLYRFDVLLKTLKHQKQVDVQHSLDEIITFCKEHPKIAWKTENASCCLLKLCLQSSAPENIVRLLEVLGDTEGIRTECMADLLAEVISSLGWDLCQSSINKLICCSRAQEQMRHYSRLSLALLKIECQHAAVAIISKICTTLSNANVMASLEIPILAACIDSVVTFDENIETKDPKRLANIATQIKEKFPSFTDLLLLLTIVQQLLDARPSERIPDTAVVWYHTLSLHLARLGIEVTIPPETILMALKLYVSSDDSTLTKAFVRNLTANDNQENGVLRRLIDTEAFWKFAKESTENKKIVASLIDKRIQWLVAIPKPVATWAVPNASVHGHPIVENFMRSNERSMTYFNFNNIHHARNWMRKHYHEICNYADLEVGGAGARAYCVILKLKMRYAGNDVKHALCHKELMELIEQRLNRLGDALCSVVKNEATNDICAVKVVQCEGSKSETGHSSVTRVPYTKLSSNVLITPNPIPLDRARTETVSVMSNVQQAIKRPVSKDQRVIVKSAKTPPKALIVASNVADNRSARKVAIVKKTSPSKVFPLNRVNQKAFLSQYGIKFPVDYKSNVPVTKLLLPTNSSSPTVTSRRPGVAKRPIVMTTFAPTNVNPSGALPNPNQAIHVKNESKSSPVKRIKLDIA